MCFFHVTSPQCTPKSLIYRMHPMLPIHNVHPIITNPQCFSPLTHSVPLYYQLTEYTPILPTNNLYFHNTNPHITVHCQSHFAIPPYIPTYTYQYSTMHTPMSAFHSAHTTSPIHSVNPLICNANNCNHINNTMHSISPIHNVHLPLIINPQCAPTPYHQSTMCTYPLSSIHNVHLPLITNPQCAPTPYHQSTMCTYPLSSIHNVHLPLITNPQCAPTPYHQSTMCTYPLSPIHNVHLPLITNPQCAPTPYHQTTMCTYPLSPIHNVHLPLIINPQCEPTPYHQSTMCFVISPTHGVHSQII